MNARIIVIFSASSIHDIFGGFLVPTCSMVALRYSPI